MLDVESGNLLLDGVAANAGVAALTKTVDVKHASDITFGVWLDKWVDASALNVTLYKSVDGGTTYSRVHSVAISSGTGTMSEYTVTEAVVGIDDLTVDLSCRAATHVKIIVSVTGAGVGETLSVRAGSAVWS